MDTVIQADANMGRGTNDMGSMTGSVLGLTGGDVEEPEILVSTVVVATSAVVVAMVAGVTLEFVIGDKLTREVLVYHQCLPNGIEGKTHRSVLEKGLL
jgi:hypothetical protein